MNNGNLEIDIETFEKKVIAEGNISLVCFIANWCDPSCLQELTIRKLAEDFHDKAFIATVDVDNHDSLAERFGIKTRPTSPLLQDAKLIETMVGFQADEYLRPYLEFLLTERERVNPPR